MAMMESPAWAKEVYSQTCPRCGSSNTKFCYYNNYSLTQPRYFCKGCRRYWTKGGSLRNVPVGSGCRKSRRGNNNNNNNKPQSLRPNEIMPDTSSAHPHIGSTTATSCNEQLASPSPSSSSSSSSASTIDIAVVYANFLNPNQVPDNKSEGRDYHPDQAKTPNTSDHHPDQLIFNNPVSSNSTSAVSSTNYINTGMTGCLFLNSDSSGSTDIFDLPDHQYLYLGEGKGDHLLLHHRRVPPHYEQDQVFHKCPNSRHGGHNDDIITSNVEVTNIFLPQLPGEEHQALLDINLGAAAQFQEVSWDQSNSHLAPSNSNNNYSFDNALQFSAIKMDQMEEVQPDPHQFSNLFITSCWSPIDFTGYGNILMSTTPASATTTTGAIVTNTHDLQLP